LEPPSPSQSAESPQNTAADLEPEEMSRLAQPRPFVPKAEGRAAAMYFDIKGNDAFPAWMIRSALQASPEAWQEESIPLIQEAVRRLYLAYGYINVQVSCQVAPGDPPLVQLEIAEGTKFVWDNFQIVSKTLPVDSLRHFFAVEKGHAVNMLEHVKSLADLADAFQEQGYLSFSYIPEVQADKDLGTFSTTINVKEGPRYILADVSLDLPDARLAMNDLIGHPYSMFEINRRLTRIGLGMGDVRIERNTQRGEVYIRSKSGSKLN